MLRLTAPRFARRRPASTRWWQLLAVTLLAGSVGCGTTVQGAGDQATITSGQGLTAPKGAPGTSPTGISNGGTATGPSGTGAGAGGGALPGGTTSAAGGLSIPNGRRPTSSIRLGVVYLKGLESAYKAVGASSSATDMRADYLAVIDHINRNGGARGIRLAPDFYAVDASSTQPVATQLQAACAHFVDDHPVDIVLTYTSGSGQILARCLQAHRIPLVSGYPGSELDSATLANYPLYWEPAQLSLDRLGRLLPSYLVSQHWVDARWGPSAGCAAVREPRIGVVTFDRTEYRNAYTRALAPTFKALGHPVHDAVFLAVSGSTAQQVADASAGVQNTVLKFASECIDHVVFMSQVTVDYLFMNVAAQQHYNPRYGLSSLEAPPVIVNNVAQPATQLRGSIGPGWSPFNDVGISDFDTLAKRPGDACLRILRSKRLEPADNNAAILALPSCEGPFFVTTIISRWLTAPKSASLLDVVDSLGSAYTPAGTYSARLGRGRHDGASSYRGFAFNDACTCFRYSSGLHSL